MWYRIQQFLWAMTATITQEEEEFVKKYLVPKEYELFTQLKIYEQKHSIQVARGIATETQESAYIKLGLLHDIGKIVDAIGPIRKSIMVLLDKSTNGKCAKWGRFKMVRCYYQHPFVGYRLLQTMTGYEETFLEAVRTHHIANNTPREEGLRILQKWDDRY